MRLSERQSPSPCQARAHVSRPASVSSVVNSIVLAKVCPRRRSAKNAAGIARVPKAVLTQFFTRRPTTSEVFSSGERSGRKSIWATAAVLLQRMSDRLERGGRKWKLSLADTASGRSPEAAERHRRGNTGMAEVLDRIVPGESWGAPSPVAQRCAVEMAVAGAISRTLGLATRRVRARMASQLSRDSTQSQRKRRSERTCQSQPMTARSRRAAAGEAGAPVVEEYNFEVIRQGLASVPVLDTQVTTTLPAHEIMGRQLLRCRGARDEGVSQIIGGGSMDCHVADQLTTSRGSCCWAGRCEGLCLALDSPSRLFSAVATALADAPLLTGELRPSPDTDSLGSCSFGPSVGCPAWLRGSRCGVGSGILTCHATSSFFLCRLDSSAICLHQQSKLAEAHARAIDEVLTKSQYLVGADDGETKCQAAERASDEPARRLRRSGPRTRPGSHTLGGFSPPSYTTNAGRKCSMAQWRWAM